MAGDAQRTVQENEMGVRLEPGRASDGAARRPTLVRRPTREAQERRDLNEVVHGVLIVGLSVSTLLLVVGVVLGLFEGRPIPTETIPFAEAIRRAVALRPSGFLALGLLVLIFTPLLRVLGSIFVFLYERDWRYAGITALVLLVMLISIMTGHAG